jgi:hypothetical protein
MVYMFVKFGNPLFPFYNGIFRSPYYDVVNFVDARFLPKTATQTLFYPFYFAQTQTLVSEVPFRDARIALVYVLLLIVAAVLLGGAYKTKRLPALASDLSPTLLISAFFVTSYVLWQMLFSIYRYTTALELISPLVAILLLSALLAYRRLVVVLACLVGLALVAWTQPLSWGRRPVGSSYFNLRLPYADSYKGATIVMVGWEPLAYVVPLFPEASRFIRAESTLTNPLKNDALQRLVRDELSTEPEIHALVKTRTTSVSTLRSLLAQYGYALADAPCQPARTRIDRDLCLYKAVRR